jgi:hypothetical protein
MNIHQALFCMKFAETAGMMNEGSENIWFGKYKGKC